MTIHSIDKINQICYIYSTNAHLQQKGNDMQNLDRAIILFICFIIFGGMALMAIIKMNWDVLTWIGFFITFFIAVVSLVMFIQDVMLWYYTWKRTSKMG